MINFNDIMQYPKKNGHPYHVHAVADGVLPMLNRVFQLQRVVFLMQDILGHPGTRVQGTIHPRNSTIRED